MAMNLKMPVVWPVTAKHCYVTEEGSSHNKVRHLRPLGIHRRRWDDNNKKLFKGMGGGVDRNDLSQERGKWQAVVIKVINLQIQ